MGRGAGTNTAAVATAPNRAVVRRGQARTPISPEQRYENFRRKSLRMHYLTTPEDLKEAMRYLRSLDPSLISLDFETASKNGSHGTMNGSLRLIQIGVDEPERGIRPEQFVIDCHAVDPKPCIPFIKSSKIETQIHYSDFEQEWSLLHLGIEVGNIYDTCIAMQEIQKKLKDMPADEVEKIVPGWEKHNAKLGTVVELYAGMKIPKENQSSDWSREILSRSQVVYAAMDVAVLPPVTKTLKELAAKVGAEKAIAARTAMVKKKKIEQAQRVQATQSDDSARARRALDRATTVAELDQVFKDTWMMTITAANADPLRDHYRECRRKLQS